MISEEKKLVESRVTWDYDKYGNKKKTFRNTKNYFAIDPALKGLVRYNSFTGDVELGKIPEWDTSLPIGKSVDDNDYMYIKKHLVANQNFEVTIAMVCEAISAVALETKFHPVKNWLESIEWDGVSRLDHWLIDYAGCRDNMYTQAVSMNILIAAVARIYEPGVKFDHMLVLEGEQGTGKSTLVEVLGGEWYVDLTLDPHNKDTVDTMRGGWIIEVSEMECTRHADVQALKAFIVRKNDRVRLAYRRNAEDFLRKNVLIGTINPEGGGYLKDETGNRRFWPVETHKINCDGLARVRQQLFAEAKRYYDNGILWYINDPDIMALAKLEVSNREIGDEWQEAIETYLSGKDKTTGLEIFTEAIEGSTERFERKQQIRIANIMRKMGWTRKAIRDEFGVTKKGYQRVNSC